jgi:hypothetical protein
MRLVIPVALAGSLAACGTTVPLAQQGSQTSGLDVLPGDPTTGAPGGPAAPVAQGQLPGAVRGDVPRAGTGTTGAVSPGSGGVATAAPSALSIPGKGRGWDEKHVYVGIIVATDAGTALQTLGVSINPGDELGDARAIVADLNRRGGLFGREISLVVKDDSSASVLADPGAAGQADCAYFAQDHPVIGVVNTDASLDLENFRGCFQKAQIPLVTTTTTAFDDTTGRQYAPFYYNALAVSWNRFADLFVDRLKAQGWGGGWNPQTGTASPSTPVKVGIYYGSSPASNRAGGLLQAAFKRAGWATDSYQYSDPSQGGSSAVLRFAANGVTHVVSDGSLFFFATAARSQGYRPRFGVTTYEGPQVLLDANGDHSQLNGAMGVGWYPTLDVDEAQDPGPGPGTAQCLLALKRGGQTFSGKRFAQAFGMALCDGLRLAVLGAKAGGGLDPASVRRGIVSLGTSFPVGGSFGAGLSATNYALPGAGRDLVWDAKVESFRYVGSTFPIR